MTNKEFETKVLGALEGLNTRFDGLEGRFDGLEGRFDGLEGKFDGLEGKFDGLEYKVDLLDKKVDANYERLEDLINSQTTDLKSSIDLQGNYMNQAFEVIARIQNEKVTK